MKTQIKKILYEFLQDGKNSDECVNKILKLINTEKSENGKYPAYPCDYNNGNQHNGLTKREYFTGIAMNSYKSWILNPSKKEIENYAELCVQVADETLRQLDKQISTTEA